MNLWMDYNGLSPQSKSCFCIMWINEFSKTELKTGKMLNRWSFHHLKQIIYSLSLPFLLLGCDYKSGKHKQFKRLYANKEFKFLWIKQYWACMRYDLKCWILITTCLLTSDVIWHLCLACSKPYYSRVDVLNYLLLSPLKKYFQTSLLPL